MGNEESHNLGCENLENSSKLDYFSLSRCYKKINPCERELIKEISINLTTLLLENFRSLVFLFSYLNNPQFLKQSLVKKLRQTSNLAIWLSEMNRKVHLVRNELLNYRKSFSYLLKITNLKKRKESEIFLEDLDYLIKGDPKSISSFFCDTSIDVKNWNLKYELKEISTILELKK